MNIRGAVFTILVSLCVSSASAQTSASKSTPLIVGQWKLNAEKSNLRLPPDYLEIRQYELRPDGFLTGLLITGSARGYHYLQFTASALAKNDPAVLG